MIKFSKTISTNYILSIGAAYGIIQVLAQDLGIESGKKQKELVKSMPIQAFLIYCAAYVVTNDYQQASIATVIYYLLKLTK